MLPVAVAHHVKILTISFLIKKKEKRKENKYFWRCVLVH
jgi:hypothetical protein